MTRAQYIEVQHIEVDESGALFGWESLAGWSYGRGRPANQPVLWRVWTG